MASKEPRGSAKQTSKRRPKLSKDDVERLVEEATVDAYDESEQVCGLCNCLQQCSLQVMK
jgi:hypothetical protein